MPVLALSSINGGSSCEVGGQFTSFILNAEAGFVESYALPLAFPPPLPLRSTNQVPSRTNRAGYMRFIDQAMQNHPIFEIRPRFNAQITSSLKPLLLHQPHFSIRLSRLHVSCLLPLLYDPIVGCLPLECNAPWLRRQWII